MLPSGLYGKLGRRWSRRARGVFCGRRACDHEVTRIPNVEISFGMISEFSKKKKRFLKNSTNAACGELENG